MAMSFRNKQRGLSFLGLIMLAGVLGFGAVIGLKLIPVYMDSWKIDSVMQAVISQPDINEQSRREVIEAMLKRLDIDAVDSLNYSNYGDRLSVTKRKNNLTINVTYEIATPLMGNLSLLAEFDKSVSS
jgi:hypothetical protein